MEKQFDKDLNKLDKARALLMLKSNEIVAEQESIITRSSELIKKTNSDLKALKIRIEQHLKNHPNKFSEKYYDLKDQYAKRLNERDALLNARTMAEESIAAAKLEMIPGEFNG